MINPVNKAIDDLRNCGYTPTVDENHRLIFLQTHKDALPIPYELEKRLLDREQEVKAAWRNEMQVIDLVIQVGLHRGLSEQEIGEEGEKALFDPSGYLVRYLAYARALNIYKGYE